MRFIHDYESLKLDIFDRLEILTKELQLIEEKLKEPDEWLLGYIEGKSRAYRFVFSRLEYLTNKFGQKESKNVDNNLDCTDCHSDDPGSSLFDKREMK